MSDDIKRPEHRKYKPRTTLEESQEKRRLAALERQKKSRQDWIEHVRELAFRSLEKEAPTVEQEEESEDSDEEEPEEMVEQAPAVEGEAMDDGTADKNRHLAQMRRARNLRLSYARQLMLPEWMIEVPSDLSPHKWYVAPKPEGKRCLVVASNGTTVSRIRNGGILHKFPSDLPGGCRKRGRGQGYCCILDCVFYEPHQVYYVLDMLSWNDYNLYGYNTEFRLYWLHQKLSEVPNISVPSEYNRFPFLPVSYFDCSPEGLHAAYTGVYGYEKEGLLFVSKESQYELGTTPLALTWKDPFCSKYFLETHDGVNPSPHISVVLKLTKDNHLRTIEHKKVGELPADFVAANKLRPGCLLKYQVAGIDVSTPEFLPTALQFTGQSSKARALPDTWSKVVFQFFARHQPLVFDRLMQVCMANTAAATAAAASASSSASFSSSSSTVAAPHMPEQPMMLGQPAPQISEQPMMLVPPSSAYPVVGGS